MATDKKISELADADALTGPEFVEVVQGGVNKKTTTQAIADLGGGGGTWGSITGTLADQTDLNTALNLKVDALATPRTVTASHTLDSTDLAAINAGNQYYVQSNVATANDLTIPANATIAFPIGTVIYFTQIGAGQTTIVAAGGVTIRNANGLIIVAQYSTAYIRKIATNEWIAGGELRI